VLHLKLEGVLWPELDSYGGDLDYFLYLLVLSCW
jgi:hypothetical protein